MRSPISVCCLLSAVLLSDTSRMFVRGVRNGNHRRRLSGRAKGNRRAFAELHGDVPMGNSGGQVQMGEFDGNMTELISQEYTTADTPGSTVPDSPSPYSDDTNGGPVYNNSGKGKGKGESGKGKTGKKGLRVKKEKIGKSKVPYSSSLDDDSSKSGNGGKGGKGGKGDIGDGSDDETSYNTPGGNPGDDSSGTDSSYGNTGADTSGTDGNGGGDSSNTDTSYGNIGDSSGNGDSSGTTVDGSSDNGSTGLGGGDGDGDDTTDPRGAPGVSPTVAPDSAGDQGDKGNANLVEIMNVLALEYVLSGSEENPERTHYEDLAHLTGWFLDDFFYAHFVEVMDVVYIGSNVDKLSAESAFVVNFTLGTAFSLEHNVPGKSDVDDLLDGMMCNPDDNRLKLYVDLVAEFDSENPFSKTTAVRCVSESDDSNAQAKGLDVGSDSDNNDYLGPIIGATAGAAAVAGILLFIYMKRRQKKGEKVPNDEAADEPEDTIAFDTSSLDDTASLVSQPRPMMYMTSFTPIISDDCDENELPVEPSGAHGAAVNEMRVLRDVDLSSMDDSEDLDNDEAEENASNVSEEEEEDNSESDGEELESDEEDLESDDDEPESDDDE